MNLGTARGLIRRLFLDEPTPSASNTGKWTEPDLDDAIREAQNKVALDIEQIDEYAFAQHKTFTWTAKAEKIDLSIPLALNSKFGRIVDLGHTETSGAIARDNRYSPFTFVTSSVRHSYQNSPWGPHIWPDAVPYVATLLDGYTLWVQPIPDTALHVKAWFSADWTGSLTGDGTDLFVGRYPQLHEYVCVEAAITAKLKTGDNSDRLYVERQRWEKRVRLFFAERHAFGPRHTHIRDTDLDP